ncbi:MAG: FIST C-terminal domain-containing protein [Actinomycetota bacterium]|nr:FIST C-terminal domain-containing protein [Actinomycetota bacterium]
MNARGAFSQLADAPAALEQAWGMSGAQLERPPDLVALFCAAEHSELAHDLAEAISDLAPDAALIGACAADGVIGAGREQQGGPALALLAATLPAGARVTPFHTLVGEGHDGPELVGFPVPPAGALVVALADPHSTPVEQLIEGLGGTPMLGGFAGLGGHGAARLFTNGGCAEEGAVGIVLEGLPLTAIVSQGARPIGPELVVTAAEGNLVLELAGKPALERVQQVVEELSLTDRLLLDNGLLIGLVIDENRPEHDLGDFLVRGVLGADSETGALAIGDVPRVGQTVRLHVRDAQSATRELDELLGRQEAASGSAALLFSCNGRGRNMFAQPDHDAGAVARLLGSDAVAGCFCQGELGPVGGRTFVHGFTASVALW